MGDMNSYMYDDYDVSGTNMPAFINECQLLDANTVVEELDLAKASILSYDHMGKNGSPQFYGFKPGETKVGVPLQYVTLPGFFSRLNRQGLARLLNESINEDNGLKTIFQYEVGENEDKKYLYYFPGRIAMTKTTSRIMPFYWSNFSHERNMLMAHELGNTDSLKVMTVLRKNGDFYKIARFYNKDSSSDKSYNYEHHRFMEIPESVKEIGPGRCISWHAKQGDIELVYEFESDVKEILDKYPGTKFVPCYKFRLCDMGNDSSGISILWHDTADTECRTPFLTGTKAFNPGNGHDFIRLYKTARNDMWSSAPSMCASHEDRSMVFESKKAFIEEVNGYCVHFEMDKNVGKKPRKVFLKSLSTYADQHATADGRIEVTAMSITRKMKEVTEVVSHNANAKNRKIEAFNTDFFGAVIKYLKKDAPDNTDQVSYIPVCDDVTMMVLGEEDTDKAKKARKTRNQYVL